MRTLLASLIMGLLLLPTVALGQETRGTISGTISDGQGVIPGATVKVINVATNGVVQTITNERGYYEARLLVAGPYTVTVEMPGFKTLNRAGMTLAAAQELKLDLTLDVGTVEEAITVTSEAPLIDTTSRVGANFTERQIQTLPTMAGMAHYMARYAPGVQVTTNTEQQGAGSVGGLGGNAIPLGGVGSAEIAIDGANARGLGSAPNVTLNTDMVQELIVDATSFSATVGHGTGLVISTVTKSGTNAWHGTSNTTYWTNKINAPTRFAKEAFITNPAAKTGFEQGRGRSFGATLGGPLVRNKVFTFLNYSYNNDDNAGKDAAFLTIPTGPKQLNGDFSDLLLLPNGSTYQIYDPLTTRTDTSRTGDHVIRDPFPGNIIPANRIVNPIYAAYRAFLPTPTNNPTSSSSQPVENYYTAGQPDPLQYHQFSARVDYNQSGNNRFFARFTGSVFHSADSDDWTYETVPGLHGRGRHRRVESYTGSWVRVWGQTVLDTQGVYNRFLQADKGTGQKKFPPTSVGLPSYLNDFCRNRGNFGEVSSCTLPVVSPSGYQPFGRASDQWNQLYNSQIQSNLSTVKGGHTLRAGIDVRRNYSDVDSPGASSGSFTFTNAYTKRADDTQNVPNLGLSWAAFMLGLPTTTSIDLTSASLISTDWAGVYVQDSWRVNRKLTLTGGLRWEIEAGGKQSETGQIVGFDADAKLAITDLAEAAYARNPIPQLAVSDFKVRGGTVYAPAGTNAWVTQQMWMPRGSASYSINDKTILKGGYGMYFDALATAAGLQTGFSQTTTNALSVDFGRSYLIGNPSSGINPMSDPFPVQASGARFLAPPGSALGANAAVGGSLNAPNPNRERARVQRGRISVQREILPGVSLEVAYNGTYGDRISTTIRGNFLPEQYWNGSNQRDTTQQSLLNANVTNPFFIGNFASLQITDPVLYRNMASNAFFTSPTITRANLLRPFPQYTTLNFTNQPVGKNWAHAIEISVNRRFADGISVSAFYSGTRLRETTIVEEYERIPTVWQTSNNARPHRFVAQFTTELPFGAGRRFLRDGWLGAIVGGWGVNGQYEYQPGALLVFPNLFFYGNPDDIAVDRPTLDRWFNVDAGFEKDSTKTPANFQKRSFPFRVDGVRGPNFSVLNLAIIRTVDLRARRSLQWRVDISNALNRHTYNTPNVTPTSTNFGRVTNSNAAMRFVNFNVKLLF